MAGQICLLKMWSKIVQEEMVSFVLQKFPSYGTFNPAFLKQPQLWLFSCKVREGQLLFVYLFIYLFSYFLVDIDVYFIITILFAIPT